MTFLDEITEPHIEICDTDGDAVRINPAEIVLSKRTREKLQRDARVLASKGFELTWALSHQIGHLPTSGWFHPADSALDAVEVIESTSRRVTSRVGSYTYDTMTITLVMPYLQTEEKYFSTLCHEWAHAVCHLGFSDGVRVGHDDRWKTVMVAMGRKPDRCHTYSRAEAFPNRYFEVACPRCKKSFGTVTKAKLQSTQTYGCRSCGLTGITLRSANAAATGTVFAGEKTPDDRLDISLTLRAELLEWNEGADDIYRLAKYEKRKWLAGAIKDLKTFLRGPFGKSPSTQTDVKALIKKLETFL